MRRPCCNCSLACAIQPTLRAIANSVSSLPGVLAVSVLHSYFAVPVHQHIARHAWMFAVLGGALIVWLAVWTVRRRHGGGLIEAAAPVKKTR